MDSRPLSGMERSDSLQYLMTYMISYKIMDKRSNTSDVTEANLRDLAAKFGVKPIDPRTKKTLKPHQLVALLVQQGEKFNTKRDDFTRTDMNGTEEKRTLLKARSMKNYFGLPIYAVQQTPEALAYRFRAPLKLAHVDAAPERVVESSEEVDETKGGFLGGSVDTVAPDINYTAQRKVAHALLTMVTNESMAVHFVYKGGSEAVIKLVQDSLDREVLFVSTQVLFHATLKLQYACHLIDKNILQHLVNLYEKGDEEIRFGCVRVLSNLSQARDRHEEMLTLGGVLGFMQNMLASTERTDFISYIIMTMCNLAPSLTAVQIELEQAVRIFVQITKRLDVANNYPAAVFMTSVFNNITRVEKFTPLLCEESIVPLLLRMIETHPTEEIVALCCEAFLNLSVNKKNRREIASSGFANYLDLIFGLASPMARARMLNMIGNLLHSNYLYDKLARDEIMNNILDNLFDPRQPRQFTAVAYCISQLACVEATALVLVRCEVVRLTLTYIPESPPEAMPYLWTLLVSLSQQPHFFEVFMVEKDTLFPILLHNVSSADFERAEAVVALSYNLSLRDQLNAQLPQEHIDTFVKTLKLIVTKFFPLRTQALNTLINIGSNIPRSRKSIMGKDLIEMMEQAADVDIVTHIQFAALLNLTSCEENCCIKLLESGAQNILVAVSSSVSSQVTKTGSVKGVGDKKGAQAEVSVPGQNPPKLDLLTPELGKNLIAATFHNLSLKRATMGPGVLTVLISIMKNTKDVRVLHVARCLANLSAHPKSKIALAKERKLVPLLTAIIRFGCEEAERVQHYCALTICNILATKLEKTLLDEMAKNGTLVNLVVVILLRVNEVKTKESLSKALFNLMSRADTRDMMVLQLDILSALLELAKIESSQLLEICMRSLYNISCQIMSEQNSIYAAKFGKLKIPAILVGRTISAPELPGAKATADIKFLCGMTMANISFDNNLAADLTMEKVADAAFIVVQNESEEAAYSTAVLLFNLSQQANCVSMADSSAVPILSGILSRTSVTCVQLACAALCNMSMYEAFHPQLTAVAMVPMIIVLSAPQLHVSIKLDAKKFLYNLVTLYSNSRVPAVMGEATAALWQFMKTQDDENVLISVGRIVKEMCTEAGDDGVHKQLVADGIMPLILKLSKIEIPILKLDMSCSIYSMTTGGDTLKVLKWDSVDILFWLTLHDCAGLFDTIRRNVGRALRNFSSSPVEARVLVSEDRLMAVLRALAKSQNEDVLWQAAGVIYNLMSAEESKKVILHRGAIALIFDLAASGLTSVRHVCSSSLHMAPNDMPDMEDPAVLSLVLCLLDADGDKIAELGEKSYAALPYSIGILNERSKYIHEGTPFAPTWTTITCEVDKIFSPVKIDMPQENSLSVAIRALGTASTGNPEPHAKLSEHSFNEFKDVEAKKEEYEWDSDDDEAPQAQAAVEPAANSSSSSVASGSTIGSVMVPKPATAAGGITLSNVPVTPLQPPGQRAATTGGAFETSKSMPELYASQESRRLDPKNAPIQAHQVILPKISKLKATIPSDTVSAIKSKSYSGKTAPGLGDSSSDSLFIRPSEYGNSTSSASAPGHGKKGSS